MKKLYAINFLSYSQEYWDHMIVETDNIEEFLMFIDTEEWEQYDYKEITRQ